MRILKLRKGLPPHKSKTLLTKHGDSRQESDRLTLIDYHNFDLI